MTSMKISVKSKSSGGGGGGGLTRSSSAGNMSLLHNMNVARIVKTAFRNPNSVGPKMLGLKAKFAIKPSVSTSDLDKARKELESERDMQKMEKSALFGTRAVFTFVQPTETKKITYREQQARLRRAVSRHKDLQEGNILDTLEKGVSYPVIHVHWAPLNTPKVSDGSNFAFPPVNNASSSNSTTTSAYGTDSSRGTSTSESRGPSEEKEVIERDAASNSVVHHYHHHHHHYHHHHRSRKRSGGEKKRHHHHHGGAQQQQQQQHGVRLMKEDSMGRHIHVQQGLYEEVKRIEPNFAHSARDNCDSRAFILLGFKTLENCFSSVLESTWRDWTGARAIYLKLHDQFDLAKIVFYHRVSPANDLDLFMYMVVVECWNVTNSNLIHLLDFVQRMRVERMNGYISLYRDLSTDVEADSNYHSGSQESLSTAGSESSTSTMQKNQSSSIHRRTLSSRLTEEEDEEAEEERQVESDDSRDAGVEIVARRARAGEIRRNDTNRRHRTTRVVETITLETEPKTVKFPAI